MSVLRFTDEQLADYQARRGVGNVEPVRLLNPTGRLPDPRESDVLAAVLAALRLHPRVGWVARMNVVAQPIDARYVRAGFKGLSDIIGQLRTGEFLAVECKRRTTKPTADQQAFIDSVNRHGGLAFVARGVEDVMLALDDKVPA